MKKSTDFSNLGNEWENEVTWVSVNSNVLNYEMFSSTVENFFSSQTGRKK